MKRVHKYDLPIRGSAEIWMPRGATPLTIQMQDGAPVLWAEVDPDVGQEPRRFRVYKTGQDMPNYPGEYVGTFQMLDGGLVLHVYVV